MPMPNKIPNWLLKDYSEVLSSPIRSILNSSFQEQKLPLEWKYADVVPLLKTKPVLKVTKHIRPISLTPAQIHQRQYTVKGSFVCRPDVLPSWCFCKVDR
jgi:hypothetical protein